MENFFSSNIYKTIVKRGRRSVCVERGAKPVNSLSGLTDGILGMLRHSVMSLMVLIAGASIGAAGSRALPLSQDLSAAIGAPVQSALHKKKFYKKAGHQLEAIAKFSVKARVLSAAQYREGREALVSPVDLALGWSKMASDRMLSQVAVTQAGRFASMQYDPTTNISVTEIVHNSSNMHMIPASREVSRALHKIKKGQVVQIEGYLVNIRHSDGWRWLTSTTRTDVGNGACEILLVKSVKILG